MGGIAGWLKKAFARGGDGAAGTLRLRSAEEAAGFPVQVPLSVSGIKREDRGPCETCGSTMIEVLITTYGADSDLELWRTRPVAIDGFACRGCHTMVCPRFLSPEEVATLAREAAEHARAKRFDAAELGFRRICNAWPKFAAGRIDLAKLMLYRVMDEGDALSAERVKRYLDTAESHLQDALRVPLGKVPLATAIEQLVRTLLFRDAEGAALAAVEDARARPDATDQDRESFALLEKFVRGRGDLFDRGTDLIEPYTMIDGRERVEPDARGRRRVLEGIDCLERHVRANPVSWQACFFIGKAHQALHDPETALAAFARAISLDPPNANVFREHTLVLLDVDRLGEAEQSARAACKLEPGDAGLRANLALVLLLAAKLDEASSAIHEAIRMDPKDAVSGHVARAIADVQSGKRAQPKTMAELEGRAGRS